MAAMTSWKIVEKTITRKERKNNAIPNE